jgi:hypothetical protein
MSKIILSDGKDISAINSENLKAFLYNISMMRESMLAQSEKLLDKADIIYEDIIKIKKELNNRGAI